MTLREHIDGRLCEVDIVGVILGRFVVQFRAGDNTCAVALTHEQLLKLDDAIHNYERFVEEDADAH
jgi:hypothetical protein